MENKQIAETLLPLIGGKENIDHLTHCITRLRVTLNNMSLAKKMNFHLFPAYLASMKAMGNYK